MPAQHTAAYGRASNFGPVPLVMAATAVGLVSLPLRWSADPPAKDVIGAMHVLTGWRLGHPDVSANSRFRPHLARPAR